MGTVYHNYEENTWEYAASRIIVLHEMDYETGERGDYKEMFRSGMYGTIARVAWQELRNSGIRWEAHDMVSLLAAKQHDYGHENISEFGQQGVTVRLWDKISRYENLLRRGVDPENESLVDTLKDMIGYCVLWLMLANNTFMFPLAGDK